MAGAPLSKVVMAGLDGTSVDWQFSGDAIDGIAPLVAGCAMLVADLNRMRALVVTDDGVEVPQAAPRPIRWPACSPAARPATIAVPLRQC